jgi:acyl-CoA synthetase (AMP-forming)/AMP-acid ligase II
LRMSSAICEALARLARDHPQRAAIYGLSEGQVRTFADLECDAADMTAALDAVALPDRPCLVSCVGNRIGFVALFLACLRRRASLVLIDGDATHAEVVAVADRLRADGIVTRIDTPAARTSTAHQLPAGLVLVRAGEPSAAPVFAVSSSEPLILKLTSGSTNSPKTVVVTESGLVADGRHIIEAMGIRTADVSLATIPISHAYGMGTLLLPLLLQGTPIGLRDGFSAGSIADDISSCRVTFMPGVPYIYDYLQRHGSGDIVARLRMLVSAGAPLDVETLRFFKHGVGVKIHSLYGTSETGAVAFDDSDEVGASVSVGRPVPETTVTLVPHEAAGPGEARVLVRGTAVADRYLFRDDADESLSAFTLGGFLTGDLGRLDSGGRLFLTGRISRFVNVAGRKVQPEEIERVIASLSGVLQASVVGVPHPTRGQLLVACVRRRGPWLTADDVRAACSARLSAHKVPRRVVFADELPVNARGKLDRDAVADLVSRTLDGDGV